MICWSCRKDVPDKAAFCPHCEAEVIAEPSDADVNVVAGLLADMAPELIGELQEAFDESTSGEDFVNRIMVGDCPKCGGSKTSDCENDPEIEDPCVGRCFDCRQRWCLDCGALFTKQAQAAEHDCPAWAEMGFDDDELDEFDDLD